ncbi:MAG: protein-disulfide reductase DsbD domain-containing protein [Phycisphaerales bacterium]
MHADCPRLAAILSAIPLFGASVAAQPSDEEYADLVNPSVIAELNGIAPGGTVWVGIHFEIKDGWHTYWPGQNDTGFGTQIETAAPAELVVGDTYWPAPHRYTAPGGILDHVHEHAVTALLPITAPQSAALGSDITVSFDLSWLVCDDVCIPGWKTITLTLPVIKSPVAKHGVTVQRFEKARERIPNTDMNKARVTVDWSGQIATVRAIDANKLAFYPDEGGSKVLDLINAGSASSDVLRLSFDSQDPVLSGVLEIHRSGDSVTFLSLRASPKGSPLEP